MLGGVFAAPQAALADTAGVGVGVEAALSADLVPILAPPAPSKDDRATKGTHAPKGKPPAVGKTRSTDKLLALTYFYNGGRQTITGTGASANLTIHTPSLDTTAGDFHTLTEIAVQSANSQQIVEVGWTIDPAVNGNSNPHLFVYNWVNGSPGCYNGCGWVDNGSNSFDAGDALTSGTTKRFGILYSGTSPNGQWWVHYDGAFVGYFPETDWGAAFNQSGLHQLFGEVAANSAAPCTDNGNALYGSNPSAAVIGSTSIEGVLNANVNLTAFEDDPTMYDVNKLSGRTLQYGGPGDC
jgi:hypothetical protein